MGLTQENKLGRYLLLFSIALFLLLTIPSLFSDGMFLDGLMYASIAKNLSLNQGEFWNLHYTDTLYNQFNEHPPLVFGLQSLFFKLFGDHLWVERWYSLGTYFVVSFFLFKTWTFLGKTKTTFWLPMLFLALIPLMTWSTANNMLENTMSVFTCSSVYFYLRSSKSSKYYYLVLSALMVFFAFLSKGFTGLYVWIFPFVFWMFGERRNLVKGLLDSAFLVFFSLLMLMLLFYLNDDALQAMLRYYERQVLGSLEHVVTVKSRFYILSKLLTELLIPIGIMLLLYLWTKKSKNQLSSSLNKSMAGSFFLLGVCGVIPIMISFKQSGFYIVTTFPFFALSLSLLVVDGVTVFQRLVLLGKTKVFQGVSLSLLAVCALLFALSVNRVGRDKNKLQMMSVFNESIVDDQVIHIPTSMWSDWNVHAYFSRLKNVSLSVEEPNAGELYLTKEVLGNDFELTSRSEPYFLYHKK